jgi:ribosomal protein S17E
MAELIENEFDTALSEMLATLRYMKSVPDIDYQVCRDQAFLRARDLLPVLRGAADLDKWIDVMGRGAAGDVINKRVEALLPKIDYRFRQFDVGLDQVGLAKAEPAQPAASPALPTYPAVAAQIEHEPRPYQVALSFAGERREYVRHVARALAARHVAVFYDEFEANALWGKDGAEHFHQIYSRGTQYMVMFISAEYVTKAWTRQERRLAISRQMKNHRCRPHVHRLAAANGTTQKRTFRALRWPAERRHLFKSIERVFNLPALLQVLSYR